jgi:phosphopantothenoylcysteine decarboxylase / phosphopantothenate---cysteine ligase
MAEKGEAGPGRMAEPLEIVARIEHILMNYAPPRTASFEATASTGHSTSDLTGRHVIVTAGPTHEPIDPVRYIANRSSGKQGFAIAAACAKRGARVTLIAGPAGLADPAGVSVIRVETAQQMLDAVQNALPADIAVFAAAVADWRVAEAATEKIKKAKNSGTPSLTLVENPDILKTIARKPSASRPALVIGFAAETENVVEHARAKRKTKGCDWIIANDVSPGTGVMGGNRNTVHVITAEGVENWPEMDKEAIGERLAARIADHIALGAADV